MEFLAELWLLARDMAPGLLVAAACAILVAAAVLTRAMAVLGVAMMVGVLAAGLGSAVSMLGW